MPVTTFRKRYLFRAMGFELDDEHLAEQTRKMGMDVDKIGKDEFSIEFSANRPDLIGTHGFARALRNFMHKSSRFRYELKDDGQQLEINVGKRVSRIRPFISALAVRNLKLDEDSLTSIINFTDKFSETYGRKREKLAMGLHNLDAVVPPMAYDAFDDEGFVPLNKEHSMKYSEFKDRESKGIKYGHLATGRTDAYVALKDTKGTMSLIPVINSERTRVSTSTKNILVDITGSLRYTVEKSADMFAAEFMDMGGSVERVRINYGKGSVETPAMESGIVNVPLTQMEREIGVAIGPNNVLSLAEKMGYEAAMVGRNVKFRVPEYRLDVINEQDVEEDIAIAYGYDYIQPIVVPSIAQGSIDSISRLTAKLRMIMLGFGFSELVSTYLTSEQVNFGFARLDDKGDYIKIGNPKTTTATMLRTWLVPGLLSSLGKSVHERMPQKLFETDMVFRIENGKTIEEYDLAAAITDSKANFNDIKAIFESLLKMAPLVYKIEEMEHRSFIEGRCAKATMNGVTIGYFGEVHPEVLGNFGIEEPTVAFELRLSDVLL